MARKNLSKAKIDRMDSGQFADQLVEKLESEESPIITWEQCKEFDKELTHEVTRRGGLLLPD
jgi:hypothetical protein